MENLAEILEEVNEAIHQLRKSAFAQAHDKLFCHLQCKGPFLTSRVSLVFTEEDISRMCFSDLF